MLLTDKAIKNIQPDIKPKKYTDGEGLYLLVKPNGSKLWQMKYRFLNKPKTASFGQYPEVSLLVAREKKIEARRLLREGKDPAAEKKQKEQAARLAASDTFETIALEWYNLNQHLWSEKYKKKVLNRLKRYAFDKIGNKPIKTVKGLDVLDVIRPMEDLGHTEASHKLYQNIGSIFKLAFMTERVPFIPIANSRGILKAHKPKKITTIKINEVPKLLQDLELADTDKIYKHAIKLLLLCFLRTQELRMSKWEYVDFDKKIWKIPAEIMKMKDAGEHWVPLSRQVICELKEIRKISGNNEYIFPTKNFIKYPYMNENTINLILRKMGYTNVLTGHRFRKIASTTLNELRFDKDVVEKQLSHEERDKVRAAYNAAEYLEQRIELMQAWADHIDKVCLEAELVKNEKISA